jgi:CRISPR type IV-associated protein Csf1
MMKTPQLVYASELVCKALNLTPTGIPKKDVRLDDKDAGHEHEHTHCAMCARPLEDDTLVEPQSFTNTFTDQAALLAGQGLVCGFCAVSSKQNVLRYLQNCVVTKDGVYSIGKDKYRTWFLLTPPPAPFVAIDRDGAPTAAFHLHWKSPVTYDTNLIKVRFGGRTLTVRHPVLMQAITDCKLVADEMQSRRPDKKKKDSLNHPFRWLARKMDDSSHGVLSDEAIAISEDPNASNEYREAFSRLKTLSTGELWALATLVKSKPEAPEQPTASTNVNKEEELA